MDKRYQVFVSSRYEDLQDERREVMQALLKMNCIPTGMELFPAADDDSLTLIQRFIAQCDYYIVVVGGRYGSVWQNGKSYTEVEYDFAVEAGLPILAFLHKDPASIPAGRTESTDQGKAALSDFRTKIEQRRHSVYWTSAQELAGQVALSMMSLMQLKPRIGWVRADRAHESAAQEVLRLQNLVAAFQEKQSQLEQKPPDGAEGLAQGDEEISLRFRAHYGVQGESRYFKFTWNALFRALGPILLNGATESQMKAKLAEVWRNRIGNDADPRGYIIDEDFQEVKIQFRALGFITKTRDEDEEMAKWVLKPYGDYRLMQLGAIRSVKF